MLLFLQTIPDEPPILHKHTPRIALSNSIPDQINAIRSEAQCRGVVILHLNAGQVTQVRQASYLLLFWVNIQFVNHSIYLVTFIMHCKFNLRYLFRSP